MDYGGLAQQVSEGNNNSNCAGSHSSVMLAKNVAAFCPCPKHLPKAKLISDRLISLAEAMSRKHQICSLVIFSTSDVDLQ